MEPWNTIIGGGFVIGAIFWAGGTYARLGRIEKDFGGLVEQLKGMSEIIIIKAQIQMHSEEIVMLRKKIYDGHWREHGGPEMNYEK